MKKTTIILSAAIFIGVVLAGGLLIFLQNRPVEQKVQNWPSRTDDQSAVTVTVTPLDISFASKEWKFSVVIDTHSVELDQDMAKVAVLADDQGKEHLPVLWQGAEAGGHHREGVLIFDAVAPFPKFVELRIKDIGTPATSLFRWDINK